MLLHISGVFSGSRLRWAKKIPFLLLVLSSSFHLQTVSSAAKPSNRYKKSSSTTRLNQSNYNNFFSTMNTIRNDGQGGRGIAYLPASGTYYNVLVFMHGLGDTADGWASLMPELQLKNTKIILPTANCRPITINNGHSMPGWTDILGLDGDSPEDEKGFSESSQRIDRMIQTEIDKGISPQRIVLAGFSQGGALALHTALRSPYTSQLGGCIALSTWLPLHASYPAALGSGSGANGAAAATVFTSAVNTASATAASDTSKSSSLRILQVHGDEDMVVAYQWGLKSHEKLKTLISGEGSKAPEFITIEGMGHSWDPEEGLHVQRFLHDIFKD